MSRIRSIHPGLFKDEAFVALSPQAQVFLMGLWTECDDRGVFAWKPLTLKMELLPASPLDLAAIDGLLAELVANDCLRMVREGLEDQGRNYGLVRNFCRWQRPKKPTYKYPFRPEWANYVAYEGVVSPTSAPPVPHSSPTGSEKSPQREREREEEGEKERGGGGSARAREQVTSLLGTPMVAGWTPNADATATVGGLLSPAETEPFLQDFIGRQIREANLSKDWNSRFVTEARLHAKRLASRSQSRMLSPAKDIERRRTAQPRVVVDNATLPPNVPKSLIRPEATKLAETLARTIGTDLEHPVAYGLPMTCESWLANGWDATVIELTVKAVYARQSFVPQSFRYFEKAIDRAHDELKRKPAIANASGAPVYDRNDKSLLASLDRRIADLLRDAGEEAQGGHGKEIDLPASAVRELPPGPVR